jgi:hypothetical protein
MLLGIFYGGRKRAARDLATSRTMAVHKLGEGYTRLIANRPPVHEGTLQGDGRQAQAISDGHWPAIEADRSGLRRREGWAASRG